MIEKHYYFSFPLSISASHVAFLTSVLASGRIEASFIFLAIISSYVGGSLQYTFALRNHYYFFWADEYTSVCVYAHGGYLWYHVKALFCRYRAKNGIG